MTKKFLKVEGRDDLVRDTSSKAILATNLNKLQEHRNKVKFFKDLMQQKDEINTLKNDVKEIKELLFQLVKRDQ